MAHRTLSIKPGCDRIWTAEDIPVFGIPIYPVGDEASFHTKNDPNDPYQRNVIVQRKGRVDIRCEHRDIVHGFRSETINDLYSFIVMKIRFDPNHFAARIKEAKVTFKFAAIDGETDPEVVAISPDGSYNVEPTMQHEQTVDTAGVNISGGTAGVQAGGQLTHQRTIDQDVVSYTRIIGSVELLRDHGNSNAATWKLYENAMSKSGIVSSLQGVILVKRKTMKVFKASIGIEVKTDTVSKLGRLFRKDPKDDDILYDPNRKPTNNLLKYDEGKLGEVDLKSLSDVTSWTLMGDTVKKV